MMAKKMIMMTEDARINDIDDDNDVDDNNNIENDDCVIIANKYEGENNYKRNNGRT